MVVSIIPRSFLFVIPLQVGAELIAACAILNKISSIYGLGALFTGHGLTPMQWILNLVSVAVVPLMIWGYNSIYYRRPLRVLAFAHFYILDTFVSLGFTVYFIVYWFAVAGKAANNPPQGSDGNKYALDTRSNFERSSDVILDKSVTVGQELATTIVATTLFLTIRFYFMFVLIGYARLLTRKTNLRSSNGPATRPWASKLQYLLIKPFESFWTGQKSRRGRARSFGPTETERLETELD